MNKIKLNNFWEPKLEKMQRKDIEKLQLKKLKNITTQVFNSNIFYNKKLKNAGVFPSSIKSLKDIEKIPFTTKEDMRKNYPFDLLSVSKDNLVRIHTSSGTTGNPVVVAYTKNDLENWASCVARCLTMTGVGKKDVFQVILGYGMFTGGLGFHYGVEKIGATVVPSSTGNTKRQIKLMKDFKVTAITSIPSYTLYMAEVAKQNSVDPEKDLNLRTISCGAEAWSESTRLKIENIFGCPVFNSYGLSEVCGPGVGFECIQQNGLHLWEDYFIVEIVDPKTGEPVEVGEKGEIVLTTLQKEAMPLLRYKTRDMAYIVNQDVCECGRTHVKISWIPGRTDDMIKIRGVNVFPTQVEDVLMKISDVGNNYQLLVTREKFLDELKVRIEVTDELFSGELKDLVLLRDKVKEELESVLGLRIFVELVEQGSIERIEGKAQRVLDLR